MIKAVIFDMDGLLIDSEPLWQEAEIATFATVGVKLNADLCLQTMGLRVDQVVDYWYKKFPWEGPSSEDVANKIVDEVIRLVQEKGKARLGVKEVLDFVKNKNVKIAIASSSSLRLIQSVIAKLDIADYFDEIYSAEFEQYGKPHPGVYISTARLLGVEVSDCLSFEDSFNGILSSKSANIRCIAVPDESIRGSNKLAIADAILNSLEEFDEKMWNKFNL